MLCLGSWRPKAICKSSKNTQDSLGFFKLDSRLFIILWKLLIYMILQWWHVSEIYSRKWHIASKQKSMSYITVTGVDSTPKFQISLFGFLLIYFYNSLFIRSLTRTQCSCIKREISPYLESSLSFVTFIKCSSPACGNRKGYHNSTFLHIRF